MFSRDGAGDNTTAMKNGSTNSNQDAFDLGGGMDNFKNEKNDVPGASVNGHA